MGESREGKRETKIEGSTRKACTVQGKWEQIACGIM